MLCAGWVVSGEYHSPACRGGTSGVLGGRMLWGCFLLLKGEAEVDLLLLLL